MMLILYACIALGSFVVVAILLNRMRLKRKRNIISRKIDSIVPFSLAEPEGKPDEKTDTDSRDEEYDRLRADAERLNRNTCVNIATDIERSFEGVYISSLMKDKMVAYYSRIYNEARELCKKLRLFNLEPTESIKRLMAEYDSMTDIVKRHNEKLMDDILEKNKEFFDSCLTYPLDAQQRRSIVSEEDNCLVISSAGSGKTSSIVGKVKYLTEIKKVKPENILLISYTNKAAAELTERMELPGLRGYTFHKLAIDLIGKITGEKPSIYENSDALIVKIYREMLENSESFRDDVVEYLGDYRDVSTEAERQADERREQLSQEKSCVIKTGLCDMDGKEIVVKSEQEKKICLALTALGLKFRYEDPYEFNVADEEHSQYKPDFSIYYTEEGKERRVYLEHFGVDEHSRVPQWFADEKDMSYEEANRRYNDGISWKKYTHEKYGTVMISTSSADFHFLNVRDKIKGMLKEAGVPVKERTAAEIYDLLLPKGSKQEKSFIRLVVTFIMLLKSNCKSMEQIMSEVKSGGDERSEFIIGSIFRPIYEKYELTLKELHQVDFTDLILDATRLCRDSRPFRYEYIIVDEFQDISLDRYNFLKVLRDGNPLAKLYCVGDDWQSIYRFSGSDMALFNDFSHYFGYTDINKIETTYRFGEPLVSLSAWFIQNNRIQIRKNIHPFSGEARTELYFQPYIKAQYCSTLAQLVASIPENKSIFLLGRYSFDDYYLSYMYKGHKEGAKFYYEINNRKIEFLTVHKSKGLEADYVIVLQCYMVSLRW